MTNLIFLISAIIITSSYLFIDILYLRIVSMIGAFGYILGGLLAGYRAEGMMVIILFSVFNIFINIVQIIKMILNKKPIFLSNELKNIYMSNFSTMTPKEFLAIYKMAISNIAYSGEYLAQINQPINEVILIVQGSVDVMKNDQVVVQLDTGFFVGEMSFITGGVASATVKVSENSVVKYIFWNKALLLQLEKSNPILYSKIKDVISRNLIKKLGMVKIH
jgi:hypothetical protein